MKARHHVLVTGGAARPHEPRPGIGFAIARVAAQAGHRVSVLDVSAAGLRGAEAALADLDLPCATATADVGDPAAVQRAIDQLTEDEPITAVVNAAALLRTEQSFVPFTDTTPGALRQAVRVNVGGVLNTVRATLPGMLASGAGVIVNIGSIASAYPASGLAAYAMTKAAVTSLTGTLAAELGRRGIHVQGLAPGLVATGLHELTPAFYRRSLRERSVRGEPASADEIANSVLRIMELPDPLQAGHMVAVDGGLSPYGVLPA